jgi:2-polyprenyl-3-methyl-5-hydroxy-6-metoxy-1,4-benzoquinol methylase
MRRLDEIGVESAQAIARFLRDQDYTGKRLSQLRLTGLAWNSVARQSASAWIEICEQPLELLLRTFYLGETVGANQAEKCIPKEIVGALLSCGLLARDGEELRSTCMLSHFDELIIASDSPKRIEKGVPEDLVLGINPTTRLMAQCSILRHGGNVLDLGAGCGPLSLVASPFASSVVGTDINQRSLDYANLNAALNGLSNVSFRLGDRFEPVPGERFDLIISNPPFFLVPVSGLVFCDNNLELDAFVESLARRAPQFLNEGGIFQMLCEWVELEGLPWEERVKPWFDQSGCDVHVWQGYELDPIEYARRRALEQGQLYPESAATAFGQRISLLSQRRVKKIFGGLITMRRRSGTNWFRVDEMQKQPEQPIGDALLERFLTLDVLESNNDQEFLSACPRLPAQVRLVNEAVQQNGAWTVEGNYLERRDDLPAKVGLDSILVQWTARFDGTQTLESLLRRLAFEHNVPLEQAIPEGLRVVKRLGAAGLLLLGKLLP